MSRCLRGIAEWSSGPTFLKNDNFPHSLRVQRDFFVLSFESRNGRRTPIIVSCRCEFRTEFRTAILSFVYFVVTTGPQSLGGTSNYRDGVVVTPCI